MTKDVNSKLLHKIYYDSEKLNKSERTIIAKNPVLKSELQLSNKIDTTIQNITPLKQQAPGRLKMLVMQQILRPAYKLWHILLVMTLIIISPLFLSWAANSFTGILEDYLLITIFIFYGLLVLLLMIPLAFHLSSSHKEKMERFMTDCDAYLDSRFDKAKRIIHK